MCPIFATGDRISMNGNAAPQYLRGKGGDVWGRDADRYQILDHDSENRDLLVNIGKTMRGNNVYVNRDF